MFRSIQRWSPSFNTEMEENNHENILFLVTTFILYSNDEEKSEEWKINCQNCVCKENNQYGVKIGHQW